MYVCHSCGITARADPNIDPVHKLSREPLDLDSNSNPNTALEAYILLTYTPYTSILHKKYICVTCQQTASADQLREMAVTIKRGF